MNHAYFQGNYIRGMNKNCGPVMIDQCESSIGAVISVCYPDQAELGTSEVWWFTWSLPSYSMFKTKDEYFNSLHPV